MSVSWDHQYHAKNMVDSLIGTLAQSMHMRDLCVFANELEDYWKELTGIEARFSCYLGNFYIYLDMGAKMPNGKYPNKAKHLALFIEKLEDLLGYRLKRKDGMPDRTESVDYHDHNFRWTGWGHFPSWQIHASHGGDCHLVKKNRRMVETFDYETVCD
jgi:hypothetical protein